MVAPLLLKQKQGKRGNRFFLGKTHTPKTTGICAQRTDISTFETGIGCLYPTGALAKKTIFVDRGKNDTLVIP